MTRIIINGTEIDVPNEYARVGKAAGPTPGKIGNAWKKGSKWIHGRDDSPLGGPFLEPRLLLDINFKDEIYILNGEIVGYSDIFTSAAKYFPHESDNIGAVVPGSGWEIKKLAGETGSQGTWGASVQFNLQPAVQALLINQNVTPVIDYRFDQIVNNGLAHAACAIKLEIHDPDFNFFYGLSWGSHDGAAHAAAHDGSTGAEASDYTGSAGGSNTGNYLDVPKEGLAAGSSGSTMRAYFGEAATGLVEYEAPIFPLPLTAEAFIIIRATVHQGTQAEKTPTTNRTTLKRFRVYEGEQPVGWIPQV